MSRNLHSNTIIAEIALSDTKLKAHWDSVNKEIVVVECWSVEEDGDAVQQSEIVAVYKTVNEFINSSFFA